jgi:hypothetical protein
LTEGSAAEKSQKSLLAESLSKRFKNQIAIPAFGASHNFFLKFPDIDIQPTFPGYGGGAFVLNQIKIGFFMAMGAEKVGPKAEDLLPLALFFQQSGAAVIPHLPEWILRLSISGFQE